MTQLQPDATDPAALPEHPSPRAAGCPFDPPPAFRALQDEAPVSPVRLWDGSTPWLITRHEDQRKLLGDPRISAELHHKNFPHRSAGTRDSGLFERVFLTMDDPDHARQRRWLTAPFAIRRVEAMRPRIQKIVDDALDAMLAGPKPADLVQAFALPVPSLVICELLGVPYEDHDFFQRNSALMLRRDSTSEQVGEASRALVSYLEDLVDAKRDRPGEDLLSELAVKRYATGEMTRFEAAKMGLLLLLAGHETTANQISLGTVALLQQPEQLRLLRDAEDPKAVARAVEELLRYLTITHSGRRRVALEDIEIGGQTIRAGDGLILPLEVGNRDAAVFEDPDRLDLTRDARRHLAFGFGVHQCLGQPLARVELQVAYTALFRRVPTLGLAVEPSELRYKHDGLIFGLYELPVTW